MQLALVVSRILLHDAPAERSAFVQPRQVSKYVKQLALWKSLVRRQYEPTVRTALVQPKHPSK